MMNTIPAITRKTLDAQAAPWLSGAARNDIVAVVSYPASDRNRRILNILNDPGILTKYLGDSSAFLPITIDFRYDIGSAEELEAMIRRMMFETTGWKPAASGSFADTLKAFESARHQKIILFALGCENVVFRKQTELLVWFSSMCRLDVIRMVLFFETNLFASETLKFFSTVPTFSPRISYLSLYGKQDTDQFITYLSQSKWDVAVTPAICESIRTQCGGCLLLIKEAIWYLRDHPKADVQDVFTHTEMLFNLELMWNGFSTEEQAVFRMLIRKEKIDPVIYHATVRHLVTTGFLTPENGTYGITVPLLEGYIRRIVLTYTGLAIGSDKRLYLDGVPVDAHFSKNERRILTLLLSRPNKLITRDELGNTVAGTEATYSDWALDSHISRLRKKLVYLGVPDTAIETRKKYGVVFHVPDGL